MIFTEKDYQSGDGMLTSVWGPSMWHFLHTMSFNYPIKPCCREKQNYYDFIMNLRNVLPCGKCRQNLCNNFKKLPLKKSHMASRATFSKYIYDLHELINNMLNKKSGLSYEEVRERYEHFRSRCTKSKMEIRSRILQMKKMNKKEKGCTEPLYGEKAKCILQIVPQTKKCDTFQIHNKTVKRKNKK
jgi:hypothetical protein